MSQKASPTAIGAFVLGAAALLVAGLLIFGSGKFLRDTMTFVLYFQDNARGLSVGAPASFRGVRIGTVNDINLIWDLSTEQTYVEVVLEILPESFREVESVEGVDRAAGKEVLSHLINDLGLRAKLAMQSLVTGQLYIELSLEPGSPLNLVGFRSAYSELPTLPSTMQALQNAVTTIIENLQGAPVREMFSRLEALITKLSDFLESAEMEGVGDDLQKTLANLRELTGQLNETLPPLTRSLTSASNEADAVFSDARKMMRDERGEVIRLADSLDRAAKQAEELLEQGDQLVDAVDTATIHNMVEELARAARSIRIFADYLERNPSAVFRGKN